MPAVPDETMYPEEVRNEILSTPVRDGKQCWRRIRKPGLAAFLLLPVLRVAMLFSGEARAADENGPLAEFYSYLPAAPELRIPEITIPFWTDDLK